MLCFLGYVSFFVHMLYHLSLRSMCIFLSSSKSKSIHFPSNHHVTPCPVTPSMHQPRSSWRGVVKPGGAGCSGVGCGSTKPGLLQKDVGQACLHLLALVQFFFQKGICCQEAHCIWSLGHGHHLRLQNIFGPNRCSWTGGFKDDRHEKPTTLRGTCHEAADDFRCTKGGAKQ